MKLTVFQSLFSNLEGQEDGYEKKIEKRLFVDLGPNMCMSQEWYPNN